MATKESVARQRKAKVRKHSSSSFEVHNVDYDGFRGPDPKWLYPSTKQQLKGLRRQVSLDVAAKRYQSPEDAELLFRRYFNSENDPINNENAPIEDFPSKGDKPAVFELAILCRQIAGKGIRRSQLLSLTLSDPLLQIEFARDVSLEQSRRAKKGGGPALADVIAPIVEKNPNIKPRQLRYALQNMQTGGVIIVVSATEIKWRGKDGEEHTTRVSNLKNYLGTARKKRLPSQAKKPTS